MRYLVLLLVFAAAPPAAAQSRANQIAAEFTKSVDKSKSKHGVSHQKFKQVEAEPWRAELRDYAGRYESLGDPAWLEVNVDEQGRISARGRAEASYEVRAARIVDGVLYGTKVFSDRRTQPLEAAFLKRSVRMASDEEFRVQFGIGMLVDAPWNSGVTGPLHVFLEKQ